MGLMPVRSDEVATIVTTLEMRTKPSLRPMPFSRFRLVRWHQPSAAKYRELFRRVGAPWLWFSRLMMDEATLLDTIRDSGIEVYAVMDPAGIEVGMLGMVDGGLRMVSGRLVAAGHGLRSRQPQQSLDQDGRIVPRLAYGVDQLASFE